MDFKTFVVKADMTEPVLYLFCDFAFGIQLLSCELLQLGIKIMGYLTYPNCNKPKA